MITPATAPPSRTSPAPTATKRLIVNADDFGYTVGVNRGIVEAYSRGILTSTTIIPNATAFDDAVACSHENPGLGVGVHLNVVEGWPLSDPRDVASLLGKDGRFHSKAALVLRHAAGRLRISDLRQEVAAQIDRVWDAELTPTHVDSHQHIHTYPPFLRVILDVAQSRGIRAIRFPLERPRPADLASSPTAMPRFAAVTAMCQWGNRLLRRSEMMTSHSFVGVLRTGSVTPHWLLRALRSLRPGITELMVHPGYCDTDLTSAATRLTIAREAELRAITDSRVAEYVSTNGIQLVHYGLI